MTRTDYIEIACLISIVTGVALIYYPLAFIVAGAAGIAATVSHRRSRKHDRPPI